MRKLLGALAALTIACSLQAQEVPSTVRIVVPFAAGGGGDVLARLVAQSMQKALDRTVLVDNKPGAGGVVAIQAVNQSRPTGEMLFAGGPWMGVIPHVFKGTNIQTLRDFVPIGTMPQSPNVLVVRADSPIKDLRELVATAKSKPLTYGTASPATPGHLAMELVNGRDGANYVHVPYKGSSAAITDVLGGQVDFGSLSYSSVNQIVKAGKFRVLAVLSSNQTSLLPGVPSVKEVGYGDVESVSQFAMYARAGTPKAVVDQLAAALRTLDNEPGINKTLSDLGYEMWTATPAEIDRALIKEYETWGPVIRKLGIQAN